MKRTTSKLEDAITAVILHAASRHRMCDFQPELRLLVSAARALICEKCGGTGKVPRPIIRWAVSVGDSDDDKTVPCDVCRSDRMEIAIYGR